VDKYNIKNYIEKNECKNKLNKKKSKSLSKTYETHEGMNSKTKEKLISS